MSTTDSIVSSQTKQSSWRKSDTTWTLGLFGTAIGAGVLFFPIRAGFGGLIPILLMLVLAYPIAFYCHRALARLCLSGSNPSGNITETVEEHFGKTGGVVITFLYFFAICPLLWIYGVTITNTFMTFWENQLQMPALNRGYVALFLLLLMAFVIWFGKDLMVKVMSYLVWPFIASLVLISLSLIPYWNSAVIDQGMTAFWLPCGWVSPSWCSPLTSRLSSLLSWFPNVKSMRKTLVVNLLSVNVHRSSPAPAC